MSGRRESSREKSKGKLSKEESSVAKSDRQTKLDSMITQINKESSMADLVQTMNSFSQQLNQLASKDYIEKSMQKLVTEEFVKTMLNELRNDITSEIKSELDKVYDQVRKVKTKLAESSTEITELKNTTSDLQTRLEKVEDVNAKLLNKNKELKEMIQNRDSKIQLNDKQLNDLEQYTRRNSIRVYGMNDIDKFETAEETGKAVITMIKDKLNVNVSTSDIDVAHRLGRFTTDSNRPLICKFVSRSVKSKVLAARRKLKGSSIVVREDLTFRNAKLLEEVSRCEAVQNAWSDEGKILALLRNGRKVKVDLSTNLSRTLTNE